MILQALNSLYDRLRADPAYKVAPLGSSLQKISFRVVLSQDGELTDIQSLVDTDSGRPRQLLVPGGSKPSGKVTKQSVVKKVQLLRSDVQYLLGVTVETREEGGEILVPDADPFRFEAFRDYHLKIESDIDDPDYAAVCAFLRTWRPENAPSNEAWAEIAKGQGVFQIRGRTEYVHDRSAVLAWWSRQVGAKDGSVGQCLVTAAEAPIARLHPPIKGVRDAQSSGGTIAGFNDPAYWSYGKEQSYNAPVAEDIAFRYTTALNALLDGPMNSKHRRHLGDMTVVFWTDRPSTTEDIFAEFLSEGSSAVPTDSAQDEGLRLKLEAFLRAVRDGREAYGDLGDDPEGTSFHLLGLSPNASRLVVRLFYRSSLGDVLTSLRRHHNDIAIKGRPPSGKGPGDPDLPPVWMLLRETARDTAGIPPLLAAPLLRAILTGARYPDGLFTAVMRRIHADRDVSYARACVVKGYLTRNQGKEIKMSLDPDRTEPAYRLGRLFAALEKTQRDALGENLNNTVRDSFYSSASATPGTVFPRLMRTYQHHLSKLEGGRRVTRERLVQEVLDPLERFPSHLDLANQGLFALGYYQQMRDFYRKKTSDATDGN